MASYYSKSSSSVSYYTTSSQTEPNMRQELQNTLEGRFPEVAKAQIGVLRRVRRDSSNKYEFCACVDPVTKEPDRDVWCPFCSGTGKYFDEEYIRFYKILLDSSFSSIRRRNMIVPGKIDVSTVAFYFEYDVAPDIEDRIVEIQLNDDGTPVTPLVYVRQFGIDMAWPYRSDDGKLEYWKVYTHEEIARYLQPPPYQDAEQ